MARSVLERWPAEAMPLTIYAEEFEPDIADVAVRRLPAWLADFKRIYGPVSSANGRRNGTYSYKFDCVKFAHKVAALTDFGATLDDGVMIWLDADTFTHADVTAGWLDRLFPGPAYLAWLDRVNNHPECGFVMFRCTHPAHRWFMDAFARLYISREVFRLQETHDSCVLQHLVQTAVGQRRIEWPVSLSGDPRWHHPFVNGPLGACMDHAKGGRKIEGRSRMRDLKVPRTEEYWRVRAV